MASLSVIWIFMVSLQACYGDNSLYYDLKYNLINKLSEINKTATRDEGSICQLHMAQYLMGLQSTQMWALTMLDATAKLNSGILVGNVNNLGNFDQCLNVEYDTGVTGVIRGQHCMASILVDLDALADMPAPEDAMRLLNFQNRKRHVEQIFGLPVNTKILRADIPQQLKLGFGICVPASCKGDELVEQLEMILSLTNLTLTLELNPERSCSTKEPVDFSTGDAVAIVIFAIFAVLIVLSTIYDLTLLYAEQKSESKLYVSFSAYSNLKRIFAIHPNPPGNKRNDNIPCIHGIRSISIIGIVMGHRYVQSLSFGFDNPLDFLSWMTKYHSALIFGDTVFVDTFFVLSGLLLAYTFMKQRAKGDNPNIPMMYVHRYLRLTPPLAAMVLFQATLIAHMGSGPYWKQSPYDNQEMCVKYWWSALLYVQNYVNGRDICVGQSWYLSVDMQVYLLSPVILIALWHYPKPAIGATVILILANIGIVFGIVYVYEFGHELEPEIIAGPFDLIYTKAYTRYGPMLLGILLGYYLFKTLNVDVKLNKILAVTMWIGSIAVMLVVVLGYYPFFQLDHKKNALEDSFYESFSRIAWSIAICWIIFACTVGYGGLINWFLSHPLWQPLSRLSYCLYLTHMAVQSMRTFSRTSVDHFSDFDMIYQFWGDFGISLTVSVLWSLAFESPITIIENEIFRRPKKAVQNFNSDKQDIDQHFSNNVENQ